MKRRVMPAATARLLMGDEPLEPPARKPRKARAPRPSEAAVVIAIKARLALYGCLVQANPNEASCPRAWVLDASAAIARASR